MVKQRRGFIKFILKMAGIAGLIRLGFTPIMFREALAGFNLDWFEGGLTCSPTPTTDQSSDDAAVTLGDSTSHIYVGQTVTKSGGYTNVCKITYQFVAAGTIDSIQFQVGKATPSGSDITGFTSWATFLGNSAWSQTDYDITIDPPQSIAQNEILALYAVDGADASNNLLVRRLDAGGTADFGAAVNRWNSSGGFNDTFADDDFRIRIYEAT